MKLLELNEVSNVASFKDAKDRKGGDGEKDKAFNNLLAVIRAKATNMLNQDPDIEYDDFSQALEDDDSIHRAELHAGKFADMGEVYELSAGEMIEIFHHERQP